MIEISRIARDIDLKRVANEGHRLLLISGIFLLPAKIFKVVLNIIFQFVRYQTSNVMGAIISPFSFIRRIINIEIKILERIANIGGERVNSEVGTENLVQSYEQGAEIVEQYQLRINKAHELIIANIDELERQILDKVTQFEQVLAPPMGRFGFLHTTNYIILAYLFLLSFNNRSSQIRIISLSIVSLIWLVLPTLEVRQYDFLLKEDKPVDSLFYHILITGILLVTLWVTIPEGLQQPIPDYQIVIGSFSYQPPYLTIPLSAGIIAVWSFLRTLYNEMRDNGVMEPVTAS
ncbi:hypothetical protein [Haloplanus natans]|uniref:hypothetical protein n=1 Tax=Haloplanus natans TaxID=376171 RepID=UPI0012F8C850|nr:hypothetical protein [Haloplanus natans]